MRLCVLMSQMKEDVNISINCISLLTRHFLVSTNVIKYPLNVLFTFNYYYIFIISNS